MKRLAIALPVLALCACDSFLTPEQKATVLDAARMQLAEGSITQQAFDGILQAVQGGRPWYEGLLEIIGIGLGSIVGGGLLGKRLVTAERGAPKPMSALEAAKLKDMVARA